MTNIVKIKVCTSENAYEKLKSYMENQSYSYELIPDVFIEEIYRWVYYIRIDVDYVLDIDFLIKMKKYIKGEIGIVCNRHTW